jgi:toxin ParE1/3/4
VRVYWSEPALENLEDIFLYLAPRNRAAAGRAVERIVHIAHDVLSASPHAGRPGRVPGTREFVVTGTPYILAYAVAGERIDILAVIHGARSWPEWFEP